MTTVRAVRGAVQVARDEPGVVLAATTELIEVLIARNELAAEDIISVIFTVTPDLTSCFPAAAMRNLGFADVPLMCATEIAVPNAMARVVRVLAHVVTDRPRSAVEHVYLGGAARLRPDLQLRRAA